MGCNGLKPNGSDVKGSTNGNIILLLVIKTGGGLKSEELGYHNTGRVGTGKTGQDKSLLSGVQMGLVGLVGLGGANAEGTSEKPAAF